MSSEIAINQNKKTQENSFEEPGKSQAQSYYTYVLRCSDNTYYTGWTLDLENRLKAHNNGVASKCTRSRRPVCLLVSWQLASKQEAMRCEYRIKQLTRAKKEALIESKDLTTLRGFVFDKELNEA